MKRRVAFMLSLVLLLAATTAAADIPVPPPASWSLLQNDPNPFCPGVTRIEFAAPQSAEVELDVLSPDGTMVARVLVHGVLAAGLYTVAWDGKDSNGVVLADGDYPYRLTALDSGGGVLFQDTKIASVSCLVSTEDSTWSAIKRLYDHPSN
jgi:FlgD Ig-like domain